MKESIKKRNSYQTLLFRAEPRPIAITGVQYQTARQFDDAVLHEGGEITNYQRDLDISKARATVTYKAGGINYKREFIAPLSDNIMIVRLTADKPGSISCNLGMQAPHKTFTTQTKEGKLLHSGVSSTTDNKTGKLRYHLQVQPKAEGGKVTYTDSGIVITGANSVTVYIAIGTNFKNYKDISGNEADKATGLMKAATTKGYDAIKTAHIATYKKYFNRVSLDLGSTAAVDKPTNVRIAEFARGK